MARFIQDGKTIDYLNQSETKIAYGDVVAGATKAFIAAENIQVGATGGLYTEGVYEVLAETTAAFVFGDKIYWDNTNKVATKTATGGIVLGTAIEAKSQSTALSKIKL